MDEDSNEDLSFQSEANTGSLASDKIPTFETTIDAQSDEVKV